jgi:hypothetical protein
MAGTVPPGVAGDQCDNDACGHASADQFACGPTEGDGAMPPGRKRTAGPAPVEALTHDDKRVSIPTADVRDLVDDAASTPGRLLYPATRRWTRSWCVAREGHAGRCRSDRRRGADLHPGEDRPAGADREPATHRHARRRSRSSPCSRASTGSTRGMRLSRCLLDEIFGSENSVAPICFAKTSEQSGGGSKMALSITCSGRARALAIQGSATYLNDAPQSRIHPSGMCA